MPGMVHNATCCQLGQDKACIPSATPDRLLSTGWKQLCRPGMPGLL